jgi:putative SOS response-associated peptidase YedK
MCVNYSPTRKEILSEFANVPVDHLPDWPAETWKDYLAPIVRLGAGGQREAVVGSYGLVPRRHIPSHIRPWDTMNARAETLGQKRSFSTAWKTGQLCLVPMTGFFEPNYESGKAERWCISSADDAPFSVAGLWKEWTEPDGSVSTAFTQITINADDHPLMKRFHKPGDEKRSLVILRPDEYDAWLACQSPELARSFLRHYPSESLSAFAAPKQPKQPKQPNDSSEEKQGSLI